MNKLTTLCAASLLFATCSAALAAVSPEEAAQLGKTLTATGAETAANADGSIPAYTGGFTPPPGDYQAGSGFRPDPFAGDKPLFSITAKNVEQHADKLTVGTRELLTRYAETMRVDVFPTHRSIAFPTFVAENTRKNATSVTATDDGLSLQGTQAGFPFPIPKSGNEVMWNHLLRYTGPTYFTKYDSINVNSAGKAVLATTGEIYVNYPYYDASRTEPSQVGDTYFRTKIAYTAPARRAGEMLMAQDSLSPVTHPRKAWQYLPGQRRVKLAPDIAYDTPNPGSAGMSTYDDAWVFNGAMDRYEFKLVGKREMYVPYNSYRLTQAPEPFKATTPNHVDPDFVRWELHRVWVVEATLKPGKRHIYAKRTFYVDEDSWVAVASDSYDARGQLFRAGYIYTSPSYEVPATAANAQSFHDFIAGGYNITGLVGGHKVGLKFVDAMSKSAWTADALAGAGIR